MGSIESYCALIPGTGSDALDRSLSGCNTSLKSTGDVIDSGKSDHPEGGVFGDGHFSRPNNVAKIALGQSSIGSRGLAVGDVGKALNANSKCKDLRLSAQMSPSAVDDALKSVHDESDRIGIVATGKCTIRCNDAVFAAGDPAAIGCQREYAINGSVENSLGGFGGNDGSLERFGENDNRCLTRRQPLAAPVHTTVFDRFAGQISLSSVSRSL
jgi:hypothetical protein